MFAWLTILGLAFDEYTAALRIPEENLDLFSRTMLTRVVLMAIALCTMAYIWQRGGNFARLAGFWSIVTLSNLWFTFPLTFQPGLSEPTLAYLAILGGRICPSLMLLSLYLDADNEPRERSLWMLLSVSLDSAPPASCSRPSRDA